MLYSRILDLERQYISLKWVGEVERSAFVIGTFTTPQWKERVKLEMCPLRGIYVKYFASIEEGAYQLKYIIDDEYKCDPALPMAHDPSGNLNNVLEIVWEASTASLSIIKSQLGSQSRSSHLRVKSVSRSHKSTKPKVESPTPPA